MHGHLIDMLLKALLGMVPVLHLDSRIAVCLHSGLLSDSL